MGTGPSRYRRGACWRLDERSPAGLKSGGTAEASAFVPLGTKALILIFPEVALLKDQLLKLRDEALEAIAKAADVATIQEMRVRYLGKKSELNRALSGLGKLPTVEERKAMGALGNEIKQAITAALKLSERMSRLMGLDKPGRLDIGAHKGSRAIEIVQINMPAGARPAEVIDVTPSPAAIAGEGGVDGESRDGRPGDIGLALREADGELRPTDVSLEVREPGGAADPVPGSAPGREAP